MSLSDFLSNQTLQVHELAPSCSTTRDVVGSGGWPPAYHPAKGSLLPRMISVFTAGLPLKKTWNSLSVVSEVKTKLAGLWPRVRETEGGVVQTVRTR